MPWEITIEKIGHPMSAADGDAARIPLGDREVVRGALIESLPEAEFGEETSGAEKLAAMEQLGLEVPEVIRKHLSTATTRFVGSLTSKNLSIDFYGLDDDPIRSIHVEIRGSGNPMPILRRVCERNGWSIVDGASGDVLRVDDSSLPEQWERFTMYRDRAIEESD